MSADGTVTPQPHHTGTHTRSWGTSLGSWCPTFPTHKTGDSACLSPFWAGFQFVHSIHAERTRCQRPPEQDSPRHFLGPLVRFFRCQGRSLGYSM